MTLACPARASTSSSSRWPDVREQLARIVASTLLATVVLTAAFFARRENPPRNDPEEAPARAAPAIDLDPALIQRGRAIYQQLSCHRCHALEGQGNPRSPIDNVGARRSRDEIRAWVTASEPARDLLSRSAVRAKEALAEKISAADIDALVEYLASRR